MAERKKARFEVLDDGERDAAPAAAEGAPAPASAVATTLRNTRMASGRNIREVADLLRIRRAYLRAIEEGRFADLPGPAYAVGFVRSFADHLGLDAEEIVNRFKEEVAEASDLDKRTDLTFPEPVSEGRAPTAPLLIVAVLVAAAVYGGWHYYSTRDRVEVERVPAPPVAAGDTALQATEAAPQTSGPQTSGPPTAATPPEATATPEPVTPETTPDSVTPDSVTPDSATPDSAPPADAPPVSTDAVAPPESAPPETASPESASPDSALPESAARESVTPDSTPTETVSSETEGRAPSLSPTPAPAARETGTSADDAAPAPVAPAGDTASTTAPSSRDQAEIVPPTGAGTSLPVVHGQADARVVLRALSDSWIQIREADGTLLATLVLREGDSYRVPDQAGLTLMTGNAGALAVTVDGAPVPPIGAAGKVRRDVSLDPDALRAGPPSSD